ncbi:unnamed protein product [Mytilus coruscus]|uniref:Uncharacterized protein n=1 Tax=Mytilus coruscus TaxID=42192 RepID=A0A6J8D8E5_MYTCO|nr:unnamed protein product [Mytilus coruscus]
MANAQVRVQLIPHARGHYLAVAGYRYCVKTRKQGRDAELVYWKCTEMDCPGTVNTTDNLVTRFPRDHNHPPSHADIKAKLFLSHLSEKARSCLDPLPTLYDSEIIQFRCREWDEDTRQIVEKIPTFTACKFLVNPVLHDVKEDTSLADASAIIEENINLSQIQTHQNIEPFYDMSVSQAVDYYDLGTMQLKKATSAIQMRSIGINTNVVKLSRSVIHHVDIPPMLTKVASHLEELPSPAKLSNPQSTAKPFEPPSPAKLSYPPSPAKPF